MKFVVLNGSPKGNLSVTLQYIRFIEKRKPEHRFQVFNVAQEIAKIQRDEAAFQEIIDAVKEADGVLWAFSLYFLLVHSNYKRFIEMIWERHAQNAFKNKYTASLSTSIHFFDHTAHNYINGICDDLGMKYVGFFSPEMADLMIPEEREKLIGFSEHFFQAVQTKAPAARNYPPLIPTKSNYVPGTVRNKIDSGSKKMLILTDGGKTDTNLNNMVQRFRQSFRQEVETVNLNDIDIKGGCLGCIRCGYDNTCAYQGKDGYTENFNAKIKPADILVFAGTIKDRYLSSRWKLFFDRSFFNGHSPYLAGKQVGFVISGPLGQIPNLRQVLDAYSENEGADLVGFVTDENAPDTDALLQNLAEQLVQYADEGYRNPPTFLSVGGHKLFRDAVWGRLRPSFMADHRYYQKHGMYDFPQKDVKTTMLVDVFSTLIHIPGFRKEYANRTIVEMVKPLQRVVEKTEGTVK